MLREAGYEYDLAISLNPDKKYRSAGRVYNMLGDHEKAITAFNLDKNSSFSLNSIGFTYFQSGNNQKALIYLNRAIELDPNSMNSFFPSSKAKNIIIGQHISYFKEFFFCSFIVLIGNLAEIKIGITQKENQNTF
jgi:tetratricopeptide (TPR) repeat protein